LIDLGFMMALYFSSALVLFGFAAWVFRVVVRREYQANGRLTLRAAFLELLVWLAFVCFPYLYNPSDWWAPWTADVPVSSLLRYAGLALLTIGIIVALGGMVALGLPKTFGRQSGGLKQTGLYRVSRNPQLVAMHMMVLGIVILWPSWFAGGWLVMGAAIGQMMVRTEEEHLRTHFGEVYSDYCRRVPRYLAWQHASVR
jgi:protein-S-isoprenylcysteine O-methyltransferase Ste14